jgi:hypothetical protein
MWLAALSGRFAYIAHRMCGHAVAWRTSSGDVLHCPGDIVCYECQQVLWCRAYDPFRRTLPAAETSPADHWGRPSPSHSPASLFEGLQQLLRLATQCPAGPVGDEIRRAACELVEANSHAAQRAGRRRMQRAIAGVELRHESGRGREDDPSRSAAQQLTAALHRELRPE